MSATPEIAPRSAPDAAYAPADFLENLVAADRRCRSWREKLSALQQLLSSVCGPGFSGAERLKPLVDLAVYARFLASGEIQCSEDGRHFRPAHHARLAEEILERLAKLKTSEQVYVARQIYPALPSTAAPFRSAEPLTRIRDIAHRNDIPSDLKREIKETLQNKLHRCAGPEDLVTSRKLLERVTAPNAAFSPEFVEQFHLFHRELEEFFNAQSLESQLEQLPATPEQSSRIRTFLDAKRSGADPAQTLQALTGLRRALQSRPAHGDTPLPEYQALVRADLALEDFAFALLSDVAKRLESGRIADGWSANIEALALSAVNIALSGLSVDECGAIANELEAWRRSFDPLSTEDCLRLKATAERARRLAETFTDMVVALFPSEAQRLGQALGVPEHAIRVFAEAQVRRHLVFQLSKLASLLLRKLRAQLGSQDWDVLVSGEALGRLRSLANLAQLGPELNEPLLAILDRASGDEEIPQNVTAMILAHSIPHLSHLAVRARQAGVVVIAGETPEVLQPLRALAGKIVQLEAAPEAVKWRVLDSFKHESGRQFKAVRYTSGQSLPKPPPANTPPILDLSEVTLDSAGPKAFGAWHLLDLARKDPAPFVAPPGLVIPFNTLDLALASAPKLQREYRETLAGLDDLAENQFETAVDTLAAIMRQLPVPPEIAGRVAKQFGSDARLIVRSSSNCEDLDSNAGAGLYESVANVPIANLENAIREVWASLWTRRAAADRRQNGVPPQQVRMAILIQPMLDPDFSFVLHSVDPLTGDQRQVYIELALGLGETLVGAKVPGSPFRFVWNKATAELRVLAFANFSTALRPEPGGGTKDHPVDYSNCELSLSGPARVALGRRLGQVASLVEQAFHQPMDIEGAVVHEQIHLVQARPQQGLPSPAAPQVRPNTPDARCEPRQATSTPARSATTAESKALPTFLALFEKRIEGDDALLELARLRFNQAGLGTEIHAGSAPELDSLFRFVPDGRTRPVVHLPRDFNLAEPRTRARMRDLAAHAAGRVSGLLLHDRPDWQPADFAVFASEFQAHLQGIQDPPLLFVEYAAGLEPSAFLQLLESVQHLEHISACVDIGHVGIRAARAAYEQIHPQVDVCALKNQPPDLLQRMPDIQCAVGAALPAVLHLVQGLAGLGKPLHFHLHDGHPLSRFSPFGVSDHLGFQAEIPLPFEYCGRRSVGTMYGPTGLEQIIACALQALPSDRVSCTLEIHPTFERRPLVDAESLFTHWRDKTNAELMNHWLWLLAQNFQLLRTAAYRATRSPNS